LDPRAQPEPSSGPQGFPPSPSATPQTGSLGEYHPSPGTAPGVALPRKRTPLWRRWWVIAIFVVLVVLAVGNATGAFTLFGSVSSGEDYRYNYAVHCTQTTVQTTTCAITLSSDTSSTGSFAWQMSSSPSGQFSPSSGTLDPGHSVDISASLPGALCAFTFTITNVTTGDTKSFKLPGCS
jgi:hypothetical protein